ncbi:MAG: heavy metal translocating P-type ATPase [Chitinophagaceae bacterium]
MVNKQTIATKATCYHCGEVCTHTQIQFNDLQFCCDGCKMVYTILHKTGMCDYYEISKHPGSNQRITVRENKFDYLNDTTIVQQLISFKNNEQTHVSFYLPQIHCSSCLWLLENLHQMNTSVISSKVNFTKKEVDIIFNHTHVSLKQVAELLTSIGYEPYISLQQLGNKKPYTDKSKLYKLGVAGFCFANIMLFSFPEYLGIDAKEQQLVYVFRYLNVLFSLPVFFYSASEFYISAFNGLKHKFLNIDAPIVLAILVTFVRSIIEVFTNVGSGYFDSLSGIVFFMLVGRVLQNKTHEQLNFERDYTAYFPIAVHKIIQENKTTIVSLPNIQLNDTLLIHEAELIPADGIITRGTALIDYSFVTGESVPVVKEMGEIVYAGGKQLSGNIEILVVKEVAQSYLTKLWNNEALQHEKNNSKNSFVHSLSKYFTWIVLFIATIAGLYWFYHAPSYMWPAITAVLIVACPCALLLSNTFTNGNILRIFSNKKLFLRNAQTIESLATINHIVFDKTGTLTKREEQTIVYEGTPLSTLQKIQVTSLAAYSTHPLSKAISTFLHEHNTVKVLAYKSFIGSGIEGIVNDDVISLGSKKFILKQSTETDSETAVYVAIEGKVLGRFIVQNQYRKHIQSLLKKLQSYFTISILSGDNEGEKEYLQSLLGKSAILLFQQTPEDKLNMIKQLQQQGKNILMIGDGLNDAGALKQANVGIAVADNTNNFTPASDGIIDAETLPQLLQFLQLCKWNKRIVIMAFIVSMLYNIIGIFFAVQGLLSPMIAAILMPLSSLTILLITFGMSNLLSHKLLSNKNLSF